MNCARAGAVALVCRPVTRSKPAKEEIAMAQQMLNSFAAPQTHIDTLVEKHSHLQMVIDDESHRPLPDTTRLAQLKREKLRLKEQITRLTV